MTSVKNVIVVGALRGLVIQVLLGAHAFTNVRCFAICAKGTRYLRLSNLCSKYWQVEFDGSEDDRFTDIVNQLAESMPDLVLISADCDGARMTCRVRDRLKPVIAPAPDCTMLDLFDNKWRFYQFCKEHGLNVPPAQLVTAKDKLDFPAVAQELGLPFILKPINQQASRGVYLIESEDQYREKILDDDSYRYAPLIAQRYVHGVDVGLNLLAVHGEVRAIAMQERAYPQNDEAKIRFFFNPYLEKVAYIVSKESRYDGVMNIDARIEEHSGEVYLFEANPRFWRSLSASVWCGLNFVAESIERPERKDDVHLLTHGSANTFYHPVFRPSLWPYLLFVYGHRGRMSRLMIGDLCTLASQMRGGVKKLVRKNRPPRLAKHG